MSDDLPYYGGSDARFALFTSSSSPAWRRPQLGALGALAAHWSLPRPTPALISLPTGTGKTAVAVASAYLAGCRRVLVVVPSRELRRQMVAAFRTEDVLVKIGALVRVSKPLVIEAPGRVIRWQDLLQAHVVVALPNSISPVHYADNPAPEDLFDLIVADEAHHAPAPTWRAILDHFSSARAVLLTATPRRRDGQPLPGDHIYHYPLRQALEEGIFKPVDARVLRPAANGDRRKLDEQIADEVAGVLAEAAHATSTLIVRAASRSRAAHLAELYASRNVSVTALHSGLGRAAQERIVDRLRSGEQRGVAVVGMLIEGFDLPSLRVLAYHDKHKSLPATAQLIGRLARVDEQFKQPSVVVTVRDIDVFPELHGVVRELYEEDADWAAILPGIIDDDVAEDIANRKYVEAFSPAPPSLSLESVHPIRRSVIHEIPGTAEGPKVFTEADLPSELQPGRLLRGRTVLYAALNPDATTVIVVTSAITRPRWHDDPGLDVPTYELHLVSYCEASQTEMPSLVFLNTPDRAVGNELLRILGVEAVVQSADPTRLHEAFDSLERLSVSSVGVRNTFSGRGTPSYSIFAGSGVDRGLRNADTAFGSFGHAMVQVSEAGEAFTAGVSTGKGKYWETRYVPLRDYDSFVTGLAERYWFPPTSVTGQLLPDLSRGSRLTEWPGSEPLAVELDAALVGRGWDVRDVGPLETLDLRARPAEGSGPSGLLPLELIDLRAEGQPVVWCGQQDVRGHVTTTGPDVMVQRGFAGATTLAELLTARPPTVFFFDGTTVHGTIAFDSRARTITLPQSLMRDQAWSNVDIGAETRATAKKRGRGQSVHEALEGELRRSPRRAKRRWILANDGAGELADYIVIEASRGRVFVDLWHAKFAHGGNPSVRVGDMQEVVAQAIKSRRWITDVRFWEEIGARVNGRTTPHATLVEGSLRALNVVCGEDPRWERLSFVRRRPHVTGRIGIVQPGLSRESLLTELNRPSPGQSATQVRDLLAVFHDSVSRVADVSVVCSQ